MCMNLDPPAILIVDFLPATDVVVYILLGSLIASETWAMK